LPPLRPYQTSVLTSVARDPVVISAPQLGKTTLARLWLLARAYAHGPDSRPWWWTAPTYAQARHGFNGIVRHAQEAGLCESFTTSTPLVLRLNFGAVIEGRSWDSAPGLYGPTVLGGVADEFGWMTGPAYSALSSRRAETVTQGLGHFLWIGNVGNLGSSAQQLWDLAEAGSPGFEAFRWTWLDRAEAHGCSCPGVRDLDPSQMTTESVLGTIGRHDPECGRGIYIDFIGAERTRMSRALFAQLYEAVWADFNDLPAYEFDRGVHVDSTKAAYDPHLPIEISCDFNVDPMCWSIGQHRRELIWTFDEILIGGGATTKAACEEFISRYPDRSLEITVFGDRSGRSRDTRSKQSDYDQMREIFAAHYRSDPRFDVPIKNPAVSARLNAVNSKLMSAAGVVTYWIHPRCKNLIADRAQVSLLPGTRDIDKRNKNRTHSSDADDYRIVRLFPIESDAPTFVGVPGPKPFVDQFIGQRF